MLNNALLRTGALAHLIHKLISTLACHSFLHPTIICNLCCLVGGGTQGSKKTWQDQQLWFSFLFKCDWNKIGILLFFCWLNGTVILQKVANPECALSSASLGGWRSGRVRGLFVTQGSPRPQTFSLLGSGHAPLILLQQEHKPERNSGLIRRQKKQEESWFFSTGYGHSPDISSPEASQSPHGL